MYIILEGIDGAGKSTQTELLNNWLYTNGFNTKSLVEPTDSQIGKLIRNILKNKDSTNENSQMILSLLFAADRINLKEEITNIKKSKKDILISDRSYYSSIAYQNTDSIDSSWIKLINKYAPKPDLMILLDLNSELAITRCEKEECFENVTFLRNTRKNYLELLKTEENIIKIDASGSIEEIQLEIQKIISNLLKI